MGQTKRLSAALAFALAGCGDDAANDEAFGEGSTAGEGTTETSNGTATDDGVTTSGATADDDGTTSSTGTGTSETGTTTGSTDTGTGTSSTSTSGTGGSGTTGSASGTTGSASGTTGSASGTTGNASGTTSGGSVTASGTSSSTGTTGGVELCQVETATAEPTPPRVMFVLDKSGSMRTEWDSNGNGYLDNNDINRWASLHGVVDMVLQAFQGQIEFGLKLYPAFDACGTAGCSCFMDPVEVEAALNNRTPIISGMPVPGAWVQGGTPTETALRMTVNYLKTLNPAIPRAQILVADGGVSCVGEQFDSALQIVQDAHDNDGIFTYVVGIDTFAGTAIQLDQLAIAGGKPNPNGPPYFYLTTSGPELQTAMQDIINSTLSCQITVDPEPDDPQLFEVWVDGNQIPKISNCGTQNGWTWSQIYGEIELCGSACDQLKMVGQVDTFYYCEPG